jgi:hypothetical protein
LAACVLGATVAQPAAPSPAPLARSTLLVVDVAPTAGGLALRVRRAADQTPLVVNQLTVTIDGRSEPATARPDGSWFVPRPAEAKDGGKTIDIIVGHDGIREVLSGRLAAVAGVPAAAAGSAGAMSSGRKQLLWWVLNIAIVVIAVIAISRRMS